MRWTLVFSVFVLVAAACTGSDGSQSEVVSRTVDGETEPESPSTTETTTTAERTPTTEALTEDEAEVLEVVRRFFEELPDRPDKTKTPDQYPDVLDEYITDPLLTRIREGDAQDTAAGVTAESYPSLYFIDTVGIAEGEARVMSCELSRAATYDPDGSLRVPSASVFTLSEVLLIEDGNGVWKIEEWFADSTTCDPVALWPGFANSSVGSFANWGFDEASEDEVAELDQRFSEYVSIAGIVDETADVAAASDEQLNTVATRHELYYLRDFVEVQSADETTDTRLNGWRYEIDSVRIAGDTAQLLMCAAPDLQFLSADDGSVVDTDNRATWAIAFMHRAPDLPWRVEYFWFLGEEECEL